MTAPDLTRPPLDQPTHPHLPAPSLLATHSPPNFTFNDTLVSLLPPTHPTQPIIMASIEEAVGGATPDGLYAADTGGLGDHAAQGQTTVGEGAPA